MRVLLVEDQPDIGRMMIRLLEATCNVTAVLASSLGEAVDKANTSDFDLIFTDIGLPDGDGRELLSRVVRRPCPPAFVLSAFNEPSMVNDAVRRGYKGYMVKPVEFSTLQQWIERYRPSSDRHASTGAAVLLASPDQVS